MIDNPKYKIVCIVIFGMNEKNLFQMLFLPFFRVNKLG